MEKFKENIIVSCSTFKEQENLCNILNNNEYIKLSNWQEDKSYCYIYLYKNKSEYQFLSEASENDLREIITYSEFIDKYVISELEIKIRILFATSDNCIMCNSKEEKERLFKLLDYLGFLPDCLAKSYLSDNLPENYKMIDHYTRPSSGKNGDLSFAKREEYNIIYFKDILKEIGLEYLNKNNNN